MSKRGNVFLVPNTLGSDDIGDTIPVGIADRIKDVSIYFVESPKIARKLLIALGLKDKLDDIEFISMKKGISREDKDYAAEQLKLGKDIGILSDAGVPAIADPGSMIVTLAHRIGSHVYPLIGPSSILLALMASGFNGQNFAFHGYLPKEQVNRKKTIQFLEKDVYRKSQTQIFIETPYRNQYLFEDLLSECQKNTKICLALNLTLPNEKIIVRSVEEWKKRPVKINKEQCIFLLYK